MQITHGPMDGLHISHKVTGFDLMGEKEIVTIDNILKKFSTFTPTLEQRTFENFQFLKKFLSNMSLTSI